MSESRYAAKPWLDLLSEAQRGPIEPDDSLVHALRRTQGRFGLATMCIGVGQGIAMIVERA